MKTNQFSIVTWYDTISTESASNGDYESTNNDERVNSTDSIFEAARWHAEALRELGFFEINEFAGQADYSGSVAYACDPDTDYNTGDEHYDRVAVVLPDADDTIKNKRLRTIYDRLVDRAVYRINKRR